MDLAEERLQRLHSAGRDGCIFRHRRERLRLLPDEPEQTDQLWHGARARRHAGQRHAVVREPAVPPGGP